MSPRPYLTSPWDYSSIILPDQGPSSPWDDKYSYTRPRLVISHQSLGASVYVPDQRSSSSSTWDYMYITRPRVFKSLGLQAHLIYNRPTYLYQTQGLLALARQPLGLKHIYTRPRVFKPCLKGPWDYKNIFRRPRVLDSILFFNSQLCHAGLCLSSVLSKS